MTFRTVAETALVLFLLVRIGSPGRGAQVTEVNHAASASESLTASGGKMKHGNTAVRFFGSDEVRDSFRRGAVLFDEGGNFTIHTSRRDAPGRAEVHTRDTDIFYVQEGSATLVTGGTVIDEVETEPNEIRGKEISGGDVHVIQKGGSALSSTLWRRSMVT